MAQRRLVSSLLAPALRFWLRSQVETVETLTLDIEAGDRQILSGHIPSVSLHAEKVVYQGLHLSQLEMTAATIRVNIGQVLRGKALRLLEPIPVKTVVQLNHQALLASTSAPLLVSALTDLWHSLCTVVPDLLPEALLQKGRPSLRCGDGYVDLGIDSTIEQREFTPVLRTQLNVVDDHILQFKQPLLLSSKETQGLLVERLDGFQLDLGCDVLIQTLTIETAGVYCQGQILVRP